jgi:hypothetical protein
MVTTRKNVKRDIFKILPPDFAQNNINRILNLSKTINEPISPKKICFLKITIFEKNMFVSKISHEFFFLNITFDANNQNTSMISFWKGL